MKRWLSICLLPALTAACSQDAGEVPVETEMSRLGPGSYQGTVQVMTHDDVDGSVSEHLFLKLEDGGLLELRFDGETPRDFDHRRVRVDGERQGSRLHVKHITLGATDALSGAETRSLRQALDPESPVALPDIISVDQKVLVVLLSFPGTSSPYDPEEMRQAVFGTGRSTSEFYQEGSRDKVKLVGVDDVEGGDVVGPLNLSVSGCPGGAYADASDEARSQLSGMGVDLGAYDKFVWYFPPNASGCPGGGVGGGDSAWIFGIAINAAWDYVSHELGHAFGLPHAAWYTNCTSGDSPVTHGGSCGHDEYGDPTDVMGRRNFQFSSFHLERLGWLEPENVLVLEQSARVVLAPITIASSTVQSLRIPRDGGSGQDTMVHVEYRQQLGFDERLEDTLVDGVLIRLVSDPLGRGTPHLLDMTPGSRNGADDTLDATLTPGRSFQIDDILLSTVEANGDTATVDVTIDGVPPDTGNPQGVGGTSAASTTDAGAVTTGAGTTTTSGATSSMTVTSAATSTGTTGAGTTGTVDGGSAGGTGGASGFTSAASSTTNTAVGGAATAATVTGVGGAAGPTNTTSTGTTGLTGDPVPPMAQAVEDSGCACRTAAEPQSPLPLGAGLLLLGLVRSRRRLRC